MDGALARGDPQAGPAAASAADGFPGKPSGVSGRLPGGDSRPDQLPGGFPGGDPGPTLEQLKGYVRSGELRFVMSSGRLGSFSGPAGARGASATSQEIADWVARAYTPVQVTGPGGTGAAGDGTQLAAAAVYDCAGAASEDGTTRPA